VTTGHHPAIGSAWLSFITGLVLCSGAGVSDAQTRLLRFPAIHGDRVAFTYAGDLWTAPAGGGTATRLTAHPGMELFARFSPDGRWIAFTGQYDGDEQVYVMPADGGEPRQLTFYPARGPLTPRWGYDNQVYGWTNDGRHIVFRSHRDGWTLAVTRLYTVPVAGGPAEPLPMPESGAGELSPDGSQIVYSPQFRDFRPEKRYGGGQANHLHVFDLKTNSVTVVSEHPRADRDPMWIGQTIYFTSDRDGTFNLFAYDVPTRQTRQVTRSRTWDVRWPSSDRAGRIVYEMNGELHVLDTRTGSSASIAIHVPDDGLWKRPSRVSAAAQIEGFDLSPKGERALIVARGDVFTVPPEKGPTRNLTRSSSAHDKWARWSPDGTRIAFISDATGEEELYVVPQDGSKAPERLTSGGAAMRYAPEWAPDGRRLAFSDKNGKVWVYSFDDRTLSEVADAPNGLVLDYTWSPRGNHLAFSLSSLTGPPAIWVWSARDRQLRRVTTPLFAARSPAWDPDGHYLYYLSDREFAPQLSTFEFNFATSRTTGIFAVALRRDVAHPFPPESDEVGAAGSEKKDEDGPPATEKKAGAKAPPAKAAAPEPKGDDLTLDFDGIDARATRVPVEADNYSSLAAKKGHLLYTVSPAGYYGREGDRKSSLRLYAMKDRKETTLMEDVRGWTLSADGSKLLVRTSGGFTLMDATPAGAGTKKTVSTADLVVDRVPVEEWTQIFHEVWRRYRDWFYVENMHGYDWDALRVQYAPLLQHVAHRSDLNYVIGEMIAELTVQHAYIEGGDFPVPPRPRVALPGARFALDKASGRYRIAKIFPGHNEEPKYRSPLTEVGVSAAAGDYVLAIDGEPLSADEDPYRLLRTRGEGPVRLTLNRTPALEGAREVSFVPVASEERLIYLDWVLANRARVEALSGGRLGYLHVPDMGADGIYEFIKWYYPQLRKEGLVVDVRANGGGNVSRMLIERLRRRVLGLNYARGFDQASTYPDGTFIGPMAAILDHNSASDGDIFPYMFREAGLGPLIGKRSWGGVVGIGPTGPLIDGGTIFVPRSALASPKPEWIIEGYGVDPDIEVDNDPKSVIEGRDPQLERTVAELMKKLEGQEIVLPPRPAPPVKTESR
jgi:tricorn protease